MEFSKAEFPGEVFSKFFYIAMLMENILLGSNNINEVMEHIEGQYPQVMIRLLCRRFMVHIDLSTDVFMG